MGIEINYVTIIITVINFVLLFGIIILIYKAVQSFRKFVKRNKEMDKKIDILLNKLENRKEK